MFSWFFLCLHTHTHKLKKKKSESSIQNGLTSANHGKNTKKDRKCKQHMHTYDKIVD